MPHPMLPAFISFAKAAGMTADRTGWSGEKALEAVVDGCCDGAFECWGREPNSMPRQITVQRWNEFRYTGRALPYEINLIEVMTTDFLKWLMPELLADHPASAEVVPQIDDVAELPSLSQNLPPATAASGNAPTVGPKTTRGPEPATFHRVKAEMEAEMGSGVDVIGLKQEALAAMFKTSRATAVKARDQLLSEFVSKQSEQTPTTNK